MTIDDSKRYLTLMLAGIENAVRYWKHRDKESSDVEQTNAEAIETALETMRKYQKIEDIIRSYDVALEFHHMGPTIDKIRKVIKDENDV